MLNLYTIRDIKADFHMPPFTARTKGEAIRMLQATLNDPNHQFSKFPDDYQLHFVGIFNETTGVIEPLESIEYIGNGVDFKQSN